MTASGTDQPHRYFFVHMQRTAGSALRLRLINHFGEAAVYPTGLDGKDPVRSYIFVDHLLERLAARGDEIRVITGHFPLRAADLIDGPLTTLTLLREPVERMLSYLRELREDRVLRSEPARSRYAGRPLEEIYEKLYGLANNHLTKMLSLTPEEVSATLFGRVELNPGHLERAKEALAAIDAVGLQERFEEFCDELTARFAWRLGDPETINRTAPVEVSDGFRARIAEDNALDVELYEFAERLLASGVGAER
jgi:hypothetical protein